MKQCHRTLGSCHRPRPREAQKLRRRRQALAGSPAFRSVLPSAAGTALFPVERGRLWGIGVLPVAPSDERQSAARYQCLIFETSILLRQHRETMPHGDWRRENQIILLQKYQRQDTFQRRGLQDVRNPEKSLATASSPYVSHGRGASAQSVRNRGDSDQVRPTAEGGIYISKP